MEGMPEMCHTSRFCGEPRQQVRPADTEQLNQGAGPLHHAGTPNAVKRDGTAEAGPTK